MKRKILLSALMAMFMAGNLLHAQESITVDLKGNAYVTAHQHGAHIRQDGLTGWRSPESVISTYFYLHQKNTVQLSLSARGHSQIKVSCGGKTFRVNLASDRFERVPVGEVTVSSPGYVRVDLQGIKTEGRTFGEVRSILVDGIEGKSTYVTGFSDYWGRRGPSVHLGYQLPEDSQTEWFYNEVTVPREGAVMHSYYMAAGFGEGYFGMQINSPTERRILFSVWSPFDTQDPRQIPESDKIRLLARGKDVHIGEFGNEGSGGQSYLIYNWKEGNTYPFLMHVHPDGQGNTIYTAYFYATDEKEWRLIASFLRPKTNTWYQHAHSFLENFSPEQGYLTRKVYFGNQWAVGKDGQWRRITHATFTNDGTAQAGVRLDYQGGLYKQKYFYLQMGGFFNEATPYQSQFDRQPEGKKPDIDLKKLEQLAR